MRILFFSNQGLAAPILAIEMEIIENLTKQGHEIFSVTCGNVLDSCYFNPTHNLFGCSICEARTHTCHKKHLNIPKENKRNLKYFNEEINSLQIPDFKSLDELFDFSVNGVNLGRGVGSSIISIFRESEIVKEEFQPLIHSKIKVAYNVALNFQNFIDELSPDLLYVFNGRFAEIHPILQLAKKNNIPYNTYERGSKYGAYDVYQNGLPHSIAIRQKKMDELWSQADEGSKVRLVEEWFKSKFSGNPINDIDFTGSQEKNLLPDNFDASKENIAIFNSSEDEFKAIPEWQNELYANQVDAIKQVVNHFRDNPEFHFYVRMHPNLKKLDNSQTRAFFELDSPNLTVIPPSSDIDTYKLMFECDKVLTFGSRTGVEATFWGHTSILYGKAFHMDLDCVYTPKSFPDLIDLLKTKNLKPKPKENTYKYGYYLAYRGSDLANFEWRGKNNSLYKGKKIKRVTFLTVVYFIAYLKRFRTWWRYFKLIHGRRLSFKDLFRLSEENKLA